MSRVIINAKAQNHEKLYKQVVLKSRKYFETRLNIINTKIIRTFKIFSTYNKISLSIIMIFLGC